MMIRPMRNSLKKLKHEPELIQLVQSLIIFISNIHESSELFERYSKILNVTNQFLSSDNYKKLITAFKQLLFMYLKLSLMILIALIMNANASPTPEIQPPKQLIATKPIVLSQNAKIGITGFGILLILIEAFVWRRQVKQGSLVSFSVFTRDQQFEISSGKAQTNNMISMQKNQNVIINQNQDPISRQQSPGIKTIKAMTSIGNQDSKKRRKRKADKLSDRKSKQNSQQPDQS